MNLLRTLCTHHEKLIFYYPGNDALNPLTNIITLVINTLDPVINTLDPVN